MRVGPNGSWRKSSLAKMKVLAKVRVGQSEGWPKCGVAKMGVGQNEGSPK